MALGLYFTFLRPPLLPEDMRYMGASLGQIEAALPGVLIWLRRVFAVMGGFMFATGLLTTYLAFTAFRVRARGAGLVVAAAGLASIGWMSVTNFVIASNFKWLILAFVIPWFLALALYWKERRDA